MSFAVLIEVDSLPTLGEVPMSTYPVSDIWLSALSGSLAS